MKTDLQSKFSMENLKIMLTDSLQISNFVMGITFLR